MHWTSTNTELNFLESTPAYILRVHLDNINKCAVHAEQDMENLSFLK